MEQLDLVRGAMPFVANTEQLRISLRHDMNTDFPTASPGSTTSEDRTTAIVSYFTLIGFIVAVIMHGTKKTRIGAFHLRQSLGLILASLAVGVCATILGFIPFVGWLMAVAAWIGLVVLWIMGLIAAINGELKPVPVLGIYFQKWFGTAFD